MDYSSGSCFTYSLNEEYVNILSTLKMTLTYENQAI